MRVLHTFGPVTTSKPAVVLAIGFFDGVHLGHQRVIELCREQARSAGAESWVMTFEPHPLNVLRKESAPRLLLTLDAKLEKIREQHVDGCMVVPFTPEFSQHEPEVFLRELAAHFPGLRGIVVGRNWRFGHKARGDIDFLKAMAPALGISVTIADPALAGDQLISSSRIRDAVAAGDLDLAAVMLGRPHALRGKVIDGLKRGRKLGFPTANLDLAGYALPPSGIYAARIYRKGKTPAAGAVYLPSHPGAPPGLLEVHIIDFSGNLYGEEITVEFIGKTREDNLRFADERDLVAQIARDVSEIRELVKCHG